MSINISGYIDHTLLKPCVTYDEINNLCKEALKYKFHSICINPFFVSHARKVINGAALKICSVVSFPLGQSTKDLKIFEAKRACRDGADEIDMVMNMSLFKSGYYGGILDEITCVKKAIGENILKVIIETGLLSRTGIVKACRLCVEGRADFVKTSTGFNSRGASLSDIKLLKSTLKGKAKIKDSGGIKTLEHTLNLIKSGADRIGTSSSVFILREAR